MKQWIFLANELSDEDLKKLFLATHNNISYWKGFLSKTQRNVNIIKDFFI